MPRGFIEVPTASGESGASLTNSTTATSIIPAARKISIPVPYYDDNGDWVEIYAAGKLSTAAATPGTLTFDVRHGATVVFTGGASPTLTTSASNVTWQLFLYLQCRTIGTSAVVRGIGHWLCTGGISGGIQMLPASSPVDGTAFDATASQALDLFATFSVASASNVLVCDQYRVKWAS